MAGRLTVFFAGSPVAVPIEARHIAVAGGVTIEPHLRRELACEI